jgi:hypothetical protein
MVRAMTAALAIALLAHAEAASAGSVCDRVRSAGATPASLLAEMSKSLTKTADAKGYVAYEDPLNAAIWTFTKPEHEAHPSVVCRAVIGNPDGSVSMDMKVRCFGTDAVCDRLVAAFKELNNRMIEAIKRQQPQ